jgi:hypothetical protein
MLVNLSRTWGITFSTPGKFVITKKSEVCSSKKNQMKVTYFVAEFIFQ